MTPKPTREEVLVWLEREASSPEHIEGKVDRYFRAAAGFLREGKVPDTEEDHPQDFHEMLAEHSKNEDYGALYAELKRRYSLVGL